MVKRARFPLRLVTDHQSAVKAFRRGRAYCCDSHRAAADIWRQIWACLDEAPDADSFLLVWVKGHTEIADVLAGKVSEADHKTNVLADRFAGEGSIAATGLRPNGEQVEAFGQAVAFYKVLRKIADDWPEDHRQDRATPPLVGRSAMGFGLSPAWPRMNHGGVVVIISPARNAGGNAGQKA